MLAPTGAPPPAPASAQAATLPSGFQETIVFSGLTNPTVVRFSADGRVFVAEKSGLIKVFDSVLDPSPSVFADLQTNVHNFWDRGLLGMALHPDFPATPYLYVLYTFNHELGSASAPPRWPDSCPNPPGATTNGCVVSGRLSRLQAAGDVMTGSEQVLVEDWCQQYPSHSVGSVEFGPDGALYVSAGEGASFNFVDYGQNGIPLNPCGDPPGGPGTVLTPPSAEGGALRSQDLRTSGDPVALGGSIIRVDPTTGAGLPSNPLAGNADANARRIIAHGLRNPLRFTFRPGTSEIWLGDVGWTETEEINRIPDPTDSLVENFGWPCYEGIVKLDGYDSANLSICENLYAQPSADSKPYFPYYHTNRVVPWESCAAGSSSIAGMAFAPQESSYPPEYDGALFFADYSRDCIWVMKKNGNPLPSPDNVLTFVTGAANPVNLEFGLDGNLYYPDFDGGTIRRIETAPAQPLQDAYISDLTWTFMANGYGPIEKDTSNGQAVEDDGATLTLNGTTFAKGVGAHANSDVRYALAGGCLRFLSSVGVDDEVGTNGSIVFQVYADSTKVYDSGLMTGNAATKQIDVSIAGANELRLVVTDGGDGIGSDHADWALARIECGSDSTSPTITARTPAPGATGIAVGVSPTATFSEAMDPTSLTTSTFTLVKQGQSIPVPALVSYQSQVATLDPTASLEASTVYTAKVKGGSGGAKDLAGNALAADVSWSFTTAAGTNTPPSPVIDTPASLLWKVGDAISFTGHATDPEQGTLPASALSWELLLQHCPSNCHQHTVQSWPGVAGGSFDAPDHEYPSYLELKLTATDSGNSSATATLRLDPQTVVLNFASTPSGLQLAVNAVFSATPFTRTVIVGSMNSLSATSPQSQGGTSYGFTSWSDGGAQTHNVVASAGPATFTATYSAQSGPPVNTALPRIRQTLSYPPIMTVGNGAWTGSTPMTMSYQWLRCTTSDIASCAPIASATAKTYVPAPADIGLRLRARVTATNSAGSASATSAPTEPV